MPSHRWLLFFLLLGLVLPRVSTAAGDPEVRWMFPMGAERGSTVDAALYGDQLSGAYALWFTRDGISGEVLGVDEQKPQLDKGYDPAKVGNVDSNRVVIRLTVDTQAKPGVHVLHLVSTDGISNAIEFYVDPGVVYTEKNNDESTTSTIHKVQVPVAINGRMQGAGEADHYAFRAGAGEELAFYLISNSTKPTLSLYSVAGTFLNPDQPSRMTLRQAPLPGSNWQRWKHRFEKTGVYLLRVTSRFGKSAESYAYQARIASSAAPGPDAVVPNATTSPGWRERTFTRELGADHLRNLWQRTVKPMGESDRASQDTDTTTAGASATTTTTAVSLPGDSLMQLRESEPNNELDAADAISSLSFVDGTIGDRGDADVYSFDVEPGEEVVFEVQTLDASPPEFNPSVEILAADGEEYLNNQHHQLMLARQDPITYLAILKLHLAEHDDCGLLVRSFVKALEPKTIVKFEKGGRHYIRVRSLTGSGGPTHSYRLVFRTPVPHVGDVEVTQDRVNLIAGQARKISLLVKQEEGYTGEIAFDVKGLPTGVTATTGAEVNPRGPAGPASDDVDSFVPLTQTATIMLLAASDAAATIRPEWIRLTASPVVDGKIGPTIFERKIPLMVLSSKHAGNATETTSAKK